MDCIKHWLIPKLLIYNFFGGGTRIEHFTDLMLVHNQLLEEWVFGRWMFSTKHDRLFVSFSFIFQLTSEFNNGKKLYKITLAGLPVFKGIFNGNHLIIKSHAIDH